MEIISPKQQNRKPTIEARNIYVGLLLIGMGVCWMLYNFGHIGPRVFDMLFSWQMLTIVLGGYLLVLRRWAAGGVVTALGVVFLLSRFFAICIPLDKVALPFIVIGIGLIFLFTSKR